MRYLVVGGGGSAIWQRGVGMRGASKTADFAPRRWNRWNAYATAAENAIC